MQNAENFDDFVSMFDNCHQDIEQNDIMKFNDWQYKYYENK